MRKNLFFLILFSFSFVLLHSTDSTKVSKTLSKRSNKESSLFGVVESNNEEEGSGTKSSRSKGSSSGFLPLPPGYNKLVIPLGNVSKSMFIMVHLSIREILDVSTKEGLIELDTELGVTWIDWEIWKYFIEDEEAQKKAKYGPEEIILDAEFLKDIWKPDIFIEEMSSVERTFLLTKLITLRFLVRNDVMPGAITFKSRQIFKVRCEMNFQYYPADTQKCTFNIRSYTYSEDKLFLVWNPNRRIFLDQIDDPNYDFQISNVEPGEELYDLFTTSQDACCSHQNFSTLSFVLQIRRNMTYHIVQTGIPSLLLILITWLCFLLPPSMVEVRIGISMTTLLTLTAMFTAVREQSPEVSYAMAIDVFMVFSIISIFVALVVFTVIYWIGRRLQKMSSGKDTENGGLPNLDLEKKLALVKYVEHSKKYSFILFALTFILFLVLFTSWLAVFSGYFNWSPSPKYNALPLEDGDESNRLFTKQEKKFRPNSTKKIVESQYRFKDLFKQVIFPRLQELRKGESEEYEEEDEETVETTTIGNLTNVE